MMPDDEQHWPVDKDATSAPSAGLAALGLLAERGPLDLATFARLSDVPVGQAAALLTLLRGCGLVRPSDDGARFVATPQALGLIAPVARPASAH